MFREVAAHHQELQLYLQLLVYISVCWPPVVQSEWELIETFYTEGDKIITYIISSSP